MLAGSSAQIAQASPPRIGNKPGSGEERGAKSNPPVFSSLAAAIKPAFEWGSRCRSVRCAKIHHCIGGATSTLGQLHVGDYGKDDRRKSQNRNKSEPIHKGPSLQIARTFRQLPTRHISIGSGRIKELAAPVLPTREVRLGVLSADKANSIFG